MRRIGFSTGALAFSDFKTGVRLQQDAGLDAVELSAIRESELEPLLESSSRLSLDGFEHVSFHAPSRLNVVPENELVARLQIVQNAGWPIVVHPDIITDLPLWERLGRFVLLENMDQRKPVARTASEMRRFFNCLPDARFCFDIAHARQVDPTMSVAVELLLAFGDRLAEIHISDLDAGCRHVGLSSAAVHAYQRVSSLIPEDTPVIIESMISADRIQREVELSRNCFIATSPRGAVSV